MIREAMNVTPPTITNKVERLIVRNNKLGASEPNLTALQAARASNPKNSPASIIKMPTALPISRTGEVSQFFE